MALYSAAQQPFITPESLARSIEEFLAESPNAILLEDGLAAFDLGQAKYSFTSDRGKCLLHIWSAERNAVRRVLDAEMKNGTLRLQVQKFGQAKPHRIEFCRDHDQHAPSAKKASRAAYQRLLARLLQRESAGSTIEKLSTAMDLERSFSPIYTRCLLRKSRSAWAVLGVNARETQSSIDAVLTFGLLWLEHCRRQFALKSVVEGLWLFLPSGTSAVVRSRLAQLDHRTAKFKVYELEERDGILTEFDAADSGNIATRLVQCPNHAAALERFSPSIQRIYEFVPQAEIELVVLTSNEIAFRLRGLEFARARVALTLGSFQQSQEIVFGVGQYETQLTAENGPFFNGLLQRVRNSRIPDGGRGDAIWRMHPERWLESLIVKDVHQFESHLDTGFVYSQVPAFAAKDRAMIDVLTVSRAGRLAVLELKADEDIHLPLQGLDYWSRMHWHHQRGEFQRYGYFAGKELSPEPPLLYLVAPVLRIHPATDTLLSYFSPQIDWVLDGIDERWREGVRTVFRKTRQTLKADG